MNQVSCVRDSEHRSGWGYAICVVPEQFRYAHDVLVVLGLGEHGLGSSMVQLVRQGLVHGCNEVNKDCYV